MSHEPAFQKIEPIIPQERESTWIQCDYGIVGEEIERIQKAPGVYVIGLRASADGILLNVSRPKTEPNP